MGFWRREVILCFQLFWMWFLLHNTSGLSDVKTCSSSGQVCHREAICVKSNSSSVCVCQKGFTGNGTFCADLDECALGTHSCHGSAACVNLIGSHACFCNVGYTGDGINCTIISINRTLANTTTFPSSKGINSTGNYSTDDNVTLGKTPEVTKCNGNVSCHANASCRNISGFIDCICHAGFSGNGVNCSDIDECRETVFMKNCSVNAHCVNKIGSYLCECDPGYYGNGQDCVEVDPCKSQHEVCDPNARCVQEDNLPKCTCDEGYFGDGLTCEDIDECALGIDACERNSTCKNIAGSYLCCTDLESCQEHGFPPHDEDMLGGGISGIHQSSEYTEPKTVPNNQARLWGSTVGVVFVVIFTVLLGVMGYRYRKRVLSERLTRHPSTIIAQIEIMMMEEQRVRDNNGDNWSLKSGIFSIPSASPSIQTLNEGDSHTNMLRKSDFRV